MIGVKQVVTAGLGFGMMLAATDAHAVSAYVGRTTASGGTSAISDWIANIPSMGFWESSGNGNVGGGSTATVKNLPLGDITVKATQYGSGTTLFAQTGQTPGMTGTRVGSIGGTGTTSAITTNQQRGLTLSGFSGAVTAFGFYLQNIGASNSSGNVTITLTDNNGTTVISLPTFTTGTGNDTATFDFSGNTASSNAVYTSTSITSGGLTNGDATGIGQAVVTAVGSGTAPGDFRISNGSSASLTSIFIGFTDVSGISQIALTGVGNARWEIGDFVESPEPASMAVLGAGLAGLGMLRRRKKG